MGNAESSPGSTPLVRILGSCPDESSPRAPRRDRAGSGLRRGDVRESRDAVVDGNYCAFSSTHTLRSKSFRLSETSVILTKPSTDYSSVKGARAATCNQRSCIFRGVVFRVAAHCRATPSVNSGRSGVPGADSRSLVHGRTFAGQHSFLCSSDSGMRRVVAREECETLKGLRLWERDEGRLLLARVLKSSMLFCAFMCR